MMSCANIQQLNNYDPQKGELAGEFWMVSCGICLTASSLVSVTDIGAVALPSFCRVA